MTCKYKVKIKDIQYNYKVQMTDIQSKYKFKVFCTGYDDSEIKEKIDAMYQAWPKVSGEGETITLNDTANTTMAIDLKGNTSQETTTGKNKYNATRSSATTNAVTYSGDTSKIYINGTPSNTGRIFFNKTYLEAGTYTFSATLSKGSFTNGGNNLTYLYLYKGTETTASWDFDTRILLTATIGNVVSATFTISKGSYYYLSWYLDTSYTWTNAEIKYQVESGSSFTSFEPYTNGASPNPDYPQEIQVVTGDNTIIVSNSDNTQSQSYHVSLGNIELCKIGDYKDRIYPLNGKWYLEKKIGKVVLDGSENWSANRTTTPYVYGFSIITDYLKTNENICKSNYFESTINGGYGVMTDNQIKFRYASDSNYALYICTTIASTLANFKTWLSTHNTIVYYVLATPTTTEITDSTLISQLEEIKEAESYSGQTNISQTNDDKPFILTATALKDLSSL